MLDCVVILEAAGWASAADDNIPLPTKKTLNMTDVAARTHNLHECGSEGSFVVLDVLGEAVRDIIAR